MISICFDSLDRTLHVVTVLNKNAHVGESEVQRFHSVEG